MMEKVDFLVIGGGIAGLTFALNVADKGRVAVHFKKSLQESNTAWAQGGIAAVQVGSGKSNDSFDLHVKDTLISGAGLCKSEIVEMVVKEAPDRIKELVEWGVKFDRHAEFGFDLHKEGGHSKRRILHAHDATGAELQRALLERAQAHPNIKFYENSLAIDLITTHKLGLDLARPCKVLGAYFVNQAGRVDTFICKAVMVATGGAGKVYLYTSNPDVATGDGVAMCYRAGVPVANMEFFQFHPTCLYHPEAKSFLISEVLRGEGAVLRRLNGEAFMHNYHELKELAPRDIVARAIDNEMKTHGEDCVLLDISHKSLEFIEEHFPNIHKRCLQFGIDMSKRPIPVVPAAHYMCGGVVCDENGQTCVRDLYVAGEVSSTGLHGANRLASNSLLEGAVYGHRAAIAALKSLPEAKYPVDCVRDWDSGTATDSDEAVVITQNWDEIRRMMWNFVGIVRSNKRLERAQNRIQLIRREIEEYYWNFKVTSDLIELRNLSLVANLIIKCAMQRKESRGLHYNIDYKETDSAQARDTVIFSQSI